MKSIKINSNSVNKKQFIPSPKGKGGILATVSVKLLKGLGKRLYVENVFTELKMITVIYLMNIIQDFVV